MGLRSSTCYKWDSPAYTRISNNPSDSFITGIPGSKVQQYDMGNKTAKFDTEVSLVTKDRIQVRHNAIEAMRIIANKIFEEQIGLQNYRFRIRAFPHHVMRENVMATGAGADRVQDGMRKSFGKPIGFASRMRKNQKLCTVYVNYNEPVLRKVRNVMKMATKKLPGEYRILVESEKIKAPAKKKSE
jgi:large subunit ribosomal protein L10e